MQNPRFAKNFFLQVRKRYRHTFISCIHSLILGSLCVALAPWARAEDGAGEPAPATPIHEPVESEVIVQGLVSYGHYNIFASGRGAHLYSVGVEYDRHSWGQLLHGQMDYVGEVVPVLLLDAAKSYNIWGTPLTPERTIIPGVAIMPIGFRLLWRDGKAFKPFLLAKGGMLAFTQKAMSQNATYENFCLQSSIGMQLKMTERTDLRLGLFSDFHFSNAFIVPVNPGLDTMSATMGISYHLGGVGRR